MGGFGSGKQGWRLRHEQLSRLDVRWLVRRKMLLPGAYWLTWNRDGEQSGSAALRVYDETAILKYRWRSTGGEWEDVEHRIGLETTPCFMGGARRWFRCPRCSGRVAVLYIAGAPTACRRCLNVAYQSQCEDVAGRAQLRMQRIEARMLAGDGACLYKPRRMRHSTFERLCARYDEAEAVWVARLGIRLGAW